MNLRDITAIVLLSAVSTIGAAQVSLSGQATVSGSARLVNTPPIPASFFGMVVNQPGVVPVVPFGQFRFWSDQASWPFLEPSSGQFTWTTLDNYLQSLKAQGVNDVFYTLGRSPQWASQSNDPTCDYSPGTCEMPTDLNADGTGPNAIWIAFVSQMAMHVNAPGYLPNHAHIKYWEIWNEVYRSNTLSNYNRTPYSFKGTYAQLVRLAEDTRCVIAGKGSVNGVPCTSRAIDPTAQIVMPSSVANTNGALAVAQNFLYCNDNPKPPCVQPGNRGAQAIDIINYHLYVNQEPLESNLMSYVNGGGGLLGIKAGLQAPELAKPLWSGEDSWGVTLNSQFQDLDLQAAFVARYHMIAWTLGVTSEFWYQYDNSKEGTLWTSGPPPSLTPAGVAYTQVYNWMVGRSMTTPCSLVSATGTVWSCILTGIGGYQALVMWDTSHTCSNGSCDTSPQPVGPQYVDYRDLSGNTTPITGGNVPVGIKPVLIEN